MTVYTEKNSFTLVTGANDPEGDPITVRRINGAVPPSWPHVVTLSSGSVSISENGVVVYDDGGVVSGHPADGQTQTNGTFSFTLWDGSLESATLTATIRGAPVDQIGLSLGAWGGVQATCAGIGRRA